MSIREKILTYIINNKEVDQKYISLLSKGAKDYKDFKGILIEKKLITEEELLLLFSQELKIPFLDLKKYKVPAKNKDLLYKDTAIKYKVVPICKIGNVLTLSTSNPLDIMAYDDIKIMTGSEKVDLVLSREEDISKAIRELYKSADQIINRFEDTVEIDIEDLNETKEDLENLISESKRSPIVRAIDLIIYNALKKGASDIHIEPYEDKLLVKYRIDGLLVEEFSFPKKNQQAVLARLKIISSLDIAESRLPQDGRFKVRFENREIDFRVSSLPANHGEKFVLRVLDKQNLAAGLEKLGFSQKPLKIFRQSVDSPFGIILVTGPTGSGKSTTLYSIISQINTPEKNIVTIEEPVEYLLEGITQIPVNTDIGLTFSEGLRSILRQSPDIVMVGEIRDAETADIAIKASLTGELIFSTLHTNSAVGAIARLKDMGVEPFLLASSLRATTAQRLVRKLCSHCKEKYTIDKATLNSLNINSFCQKHGDVVNFYKPKGCEFCGQTGYKGRVAILEVILLDDKMRTMIVEHASEAEITKYAKEYRDYETLKEDGLVKCIEGITSLEEVIRVTSD